MNRSAFLRGRSLLKNKDAHSSARVTGANIKLVVCRSGQAVFVAWNACFQKHAAVNRARNNSRQRGSAMVEMPLFLFVLFVIITFPIFNLVSVSMRMVFVRYACESAAREAASAPTYRTNRQSALCAVNRAREKVNEVCSTFSGIQLMNVDTSILSLPLNGGGSQESHAPLPNPDIETFIYQYRVRVQAKVEPLITYRGNFFGDVPGLTGPMIVSYKMERVCEKPEGLIE